jgi:heterogeneous nuclear ribonucleoprotein F/H
MSDRGRSPSQSRERPPRDVDRSRENSRERRRHSTSRSRSPSQRRRNGATAVGGRGRNKGKEREDSCVVKCRGLPYSATMADIAEFFDGCALAPDGVHICTNQTGRPSGEAFVRFATKEDAANALKKDRETMDKRYVEVFPSSDSDMSQAVDNTVRSPDSFDIQRTVRLRGLPYSVTKDDIRSFFKDLPIGTTGLVLCESREGRRNGEAFVQFANESHVEEALKLDKGTIGQRYVEIFKVTREDLQNYFGHGSRRGPGGAYLCVPCVLTCLHRFMVLPPLPWHVFACNIRYVHTCTRHETREPCIRHETREPCTRHETREPCTRYETRKSCTRHETRKSCTRHERQCANCIFEYKSFMCG